MVEHAVEVELLIDRVGDSDDPVSTVGHSNVQGTSRIAPLNWAADEVLRDIVRGRLRDPWGLRSIECNLLKQGRLDVALDAEVVAQVAWMRIEVLAASTYGVDGYRRPTEVEAFVQPLAIAASRHHRGYDRAEVVRGRASKSLDELERPVVEHAVSDVGP